MFWCHLMAILVCQMLSLHRYKVARGFKTCLFIRPQPEKRQSQTRAYKKEKPSKLDGFFVACNTDFVANPILFDFVKCIILIYKHIGEEKL